MRGWDDRVAIITGGGKGLGRAFAVDLARRGVRVVVNNRNREVDADGRGPADHVVAEIRAAGGTAVAHHGAVEDPASADGMVDLAIGAWGRLDILITSAGISGPQMFHKATLDNVRQVLDVNVLGTVLVASAAARVMRAAGHGRILMVSSTAGLFGEPTVSAYAASKGAVIALAKTVAVGTTLFSDPSAPARIRDELAAELAALGVSSSEQARGIAHEQALPKRKQLDLGSRV